MKEILSNKEKLDILCKIEQRGAAAWKQDFFRDTGRGGLMLKKEKRERKKQEALSSEYRLELLFQGQQVDMKGLELINVNYLYFRVVALGSLETSRMEVGR